VSVALSWSLERVFITGGMPLAQELTWPQWLERVQSAQQARVFLGEAHAVLQDERGEALTRLPRYDPNWLQPLKALPSVWIQPMEVLPGHGMWLALARGLPWLVVLGAAFHLGLRYWPRPGLRATPEAGAAAHHVQSLQVEGVPTLDELAGVERIQQELHEVLDGLLRPQRFLTLGIEPPRGVLLYGPPGTGKTMLVRSLAAQAQVPCFALAGSSFVEMYVGVGGGAGA